MFLRFKMNVRSEIEIVTFTTLYPNSIQPNHGVFVETRLRQLLATGYVASRVVAPVPWFPFSSHTIDCIGFQPVGYCKGGDDE